MSGRVGVADLRKRLAAVLDAAESGSVFLITRSGRDVAVIGPASGSVTELSREMDDCARSLREAESVGNMARAEVARLRSRVEDLEAELANVRETASGRRKWGR